MPTVLADIGRASTENVASDQHARPTAEVGRTPDAGADAKLSEELSGAGAEGTRPIASAEMERADDLDGLSQLMKVSKSTKRY
jgi:hypothetical protein